MIQKLVDRFMEKKSVLLEQFRQKHPNDYTDIVRATVSLLDNDDDYSADLLDPNRITVINHGDYHSLQSLSTI